MKRSAISAHEPIVLLAAAARRLRRRHRRQDRGRCRHDAGEGRVGRRRRGDHQPVGGRREARPRAAQGRRRARPRGARGDAAERAAAANRKASSARARALFPRHRVQRLRRRLAQPRAGARGRRGILRDARLRRTRSIRGSSATSCPISTHVPGRAGVAAAAAGAEAADALSRLSRRPIPTPEIVADWPEDIDPILRAADDRAGDDGAECRR